MYTLCDKIKQVESLKNGKGVQYLLNAAYTILDNPIVMSDREYSLLSYTEGVRTDDQFWNETIKNGAFDNETQEFFKEEAFIDAVANASTITFLLSDKLNYERIFGKVFNKNNTYVANLVMVACNRQFETEDPLIFEAVCKTLSQEISIGDARQNHEEICEESLIRQLIEGSVNDKELYTARMSILYDGFKDNLYLAVIDITQCDPEYAKLAYYKRLLRKRLLDYKFSIYANYIVIIMSSSNAEIDVRKDLVELNRFLRRRNMYAGVSGYFENLFELQKYYTDALNALKKGSISNSKQRIFLYDGIK